MYFRILVNQNGAKFFRTSRIPTPGKADLLRSMFVEAFPASEGYEVEVLVATEPNGAIISQQQLVDLWEVNEANADADSDENAKFA